jgi:drug/metabolite transporter (DMT)-like permease
MKYLYLVIGAIVLFGISAFLRKLFLDRYYPFQLQIIAGVVYGMLIPFWMWLLPSDSPSFQHKEVIYGILCVICSIGGGLMFSYMLKGGASAGVSSALISLSPVVTLGLSFLFFHENLSIWKIIAFILALISAILVNF